MRPLNTDDLKNFLTSSTGCGLVSHNGRPIEAMTEEEIVLCFMNVLGAMWGRVNYIR